jgi:hypothetical protein
MTRTTVNRLKLLAILVLNLPIVVLLALSYFVTSETSDALQAHFERVQVGLPVDGSANTFLIDEMQFLEKSGNHDPIHYYAEREDAWLPGARIAITFDPSGRVSGKKIVHPGVAAICKHVLARLGT